MDALILNQNSKTIEYEGKKYNCKFQIIEEEAIDVSIFLLNSLKFKGKITLEKIKNQIFYFSESNIKEIYEEIIQLELDNFSIIKENDKYKLKIKIIILNKENCLLIDLIENKDINLINNEIINFYESIIKEKENTISKLREIIKFKDEKINSLKEQLKYIQNNKFEDIQNNLYSYKSEFKINNEKEEKEKRKKEEVERKGKEKRKEEERKEKEKREKEEERNKREKEKREKEEEERNKRENIDKELFRHNNNNHNRELIFGSHNKKIVKLENLYYSYECTNNDNNLKAYINEKTETAKIDVTLKNDGTLDWPENDTKLIFDENFNVKGEEIILKPQKKGTELNYKIIFNNLDKLTEGEYHSCAKVTVKGRQIGGK